MLSRLRRFKHVLSVMVIGMAVSLAAVDFAEARRAGSSGFGSRGTRTYSAPPTTRTAPDTAAPIQRSMTPNTQTNAANPGMAAGQQAAGQQARRGLFGGFGGGILGGLFLGGLFGMMMGHGFGGLAGMFGMLFQMLLIGGLIFLLMRMFARRTQPATGSASRYSYDAPPAQGAGFRIPQMGSAGAAAAGAAAATRPRVASKATDEIGITNGDLDAFERLLTDVQSAYGAEDYARLRVLATPEAMSYLAEELGENATQGVRNEVTDVRLLQGDLAESWRENGLDYATVAMRYQSIDVMRNRKTGAVTQGDPATPTQTTEVWTFVRKPGEDWKLSAIQGTD
ncbi:Predicted lipid-binding transport protein, Tim44 family [Rhizobium sp. RU35A]|uniref:Tim44 domain-containing protein n=1 Tax=Rhizobium straminoryzae TaxID=1387186 RepID=A0A549T1X4_9HYPH|nr:MULTISPECIES: Tim44 domain-containing protein [Rhizobium]TRL35869.1 Tim44 domain-containing protein [Rhizobium straminoryzae]SIQ17037.1 Predicted lipid-binding transport protein, Tim44 family [Rhizobium sp. RU35A]